MSVAKRWAGAALAVAAACAPAGTVEVPSPQQIPALEAQYRSAPGDATLRTRLAAAYRAANRPQEAVALLEPVAGTGGPAQAVTLAGAYEDLNRFEDARRIYTRLATTTGGRLQTEVRARLLALERLELRYAVQQAIAREEELRNATPAADAVGVFPFLVTTTNAELEPLSRAMAELLSVDLAQTDRLRVVERARLQYLLDELELAESGRVDTLTAARAGHLVGAGRIVQGRIGGQAQTIDLGSAVVRVGTPEAVRMLTESGALNELFDMEKELALAIYDAAGVQLTAAERERVNRRHTENVQALLAFGFGLESADEGRYAEALEQFDRARELDAGFAQAQEWYTRTQANLDFQRQGPQGLLQVAGGGGPATGGSDDVPQWVQIRQQFIEIERMIPDPQTRDAVPEVLGVEGLERGAILELIIRRPAGGAP